VKLSYGDIKALWIANGGAPSRADIMAAIALAESGGNTEAHNTRAPDDSVGLWQINYFGSLRQGRTSAYGTPEKLLKDPAAQARAAIDISSNGQNLQPWSTFTSGAYQKYLDPSVPPSTLPLPGSPGYTPPTSADLGGSQATAGDCLISAPVVGCLFQKSWGFALLGGLELGVAGVVVLFGVAILVGGAAARALPSPVLQGLATGAGVRAATRPVATVPAAPAAPTSAVESSPTIVVESSRQAPQAPQRDAIERPRREAITR